MAAPQYTGQDRRVESIGPHKWTPWSHTFTFSIGLVDTTYIQRVKLPAAFRACEVSAVADVVANDPSYVVSDGAAGGTDLVAVRDLAASDTFDTVITPTSTPALANRDMDKGNDLTVTVVNDGDATFTDLTITVSGYLVGYIVASAVND